MQIQVTSLAGLMVLATSTEIPSRRRERGPLQRAGRSASGLRFRDCYRAGAIVKCAYLRSSARRADREQQEAEDREGGVLDRVARQLGIEEGSHAPFAVLLSEDARVAHPAMWKRLPEDINPRDPADRVTTHRLPDVRLTSMS